MAMEMQFAPFSVMVGALAITSVQLGAIELAEIVRAQGGLPWQFAAARRYFAGRGGSRQVIARRPDLRRT